MSEHLEPVLEPLTGVSIARHQSHCGFCDTPIEIGTPRCERNIHHAPGSFNRNNGDNVGHNSGGNMNLYLHPTCSFHPKRTKRSPKCRGGCNQQIPSSTWCFVSILGSGKNSVRCQQSTTPEVWLCVQCVTSFVDTHHDMLRGYISGGECLTGW